MTAQTPTHLRRRPAPPARLTLQVNQQAVAVDVDVRTSLLDLVREQLHLTGTKKGCNQGGCGACTVLVDGQRVLSCLTLAVQHEGRSITTIEGVDHPLQRAFVERDAFQCGFCTSGQICSAVGALDEIERAVPSHATPDVSVGEIDVTRAEIAERMSGNLCRCGAYNGIVDAVSDVAKRETLR